MLSLPTGREVVGGGGYGLCCEEWGLLVVGDGDCAVG